MKKTWKKPQLVILVRGKPEELVLTPCKAELQASEGPGDYNNLCRYGDGGPCHSWGDS